MKVENEASSAGHLYSLDSFAAETTMGCLGIFSRLLASRAFSQTPGPEQLVAELQGQTLFNSYARLTNPVGPDWHFFCGYLVHFVLVASFSSILLWLAV